jgi:TRAP transporter TAXI family solute receptor
MQTALRRAWFGRAWFGAALVLALAGFGGQAAQAQTYGLATMQPGTLANTVASAIAKTLKEKGGLNTLVQATAGESVLIPMVARGEIDLGMANMLEVVEGIETGKLQNDLRVIGSIYVLRIGFFTRKDSGIVNMADVRGKRVPAGYSAMRTLDKNTLAMLATANLTLNDVKPVMVPNVLRGGDDFMAGNADMFSFAFGGPKVKEADATVGGIRALEIDEAGMPAAKKIMPWAYLTQIGPGPIFTGVEKPMKVYSFDNVMIASSKVSDALITKVLELMESNKDDLVAVQPVLREWTPAFGYKQYGVPYHPGAEKFFKDKHLTKQPLG